MKHLFLIKHTRLEMHLCSLVMGVLYLLFHLVQQSSDNTQESRWNLCAEQGRIDKGTQNI